jgi:hypothetical protein
MNGSDSLSAEKNGDVQRCRGGGEGVTVAEERVGGEVDTRAERSAGGTRERPPNSGVSSDEVHADSLAGPKLKLKLNGAAASLHMDRAATNAGTTGAGLLIWDPLSKSTRSTITKAQPSNGALSNVAIALQLTDTHDALRAFLCVRRDARSAPTATVLYGALGCQ